MQGFGLCGLLCKATLASVPGLPGACELADCVDPWWASRCRSICAERADCSDLSSTRTRSGYRFQASSNACIESVAFWAGGSLDTVGVFAFAGNGRIESGPFKTAGRFRRQLVASLMHAGSVANRSRFDLDVTGIPPFSGLYVSYSPWGGVGSQRGGLIATCELVERLGAKMIADPTSFTVFDRAHFIQAGNTAMDPDSVVCADEESVVYHHGCAIVRYSGDGRAITFVVEGKAFSLVYDLVKQRLFLEEYSCIDGASVRLFRFPSLSSELESMASILQFWLPSLSELESMWQRVRASRHTAGWYDETALFLHVLTDLEMANSLLRIMSLAPVRCVVLSFVGFDGMIGIPAAETDVLKRDAPLGAGFETRPRRACVCNREQRRAEPGRLSATLLLRAS